MKTWMWLAVLGLLAALVAGIQESRIAGLKQRIAQLERSASTAAGPAREFTGRVMGDPGGGVERPTRTDRSPGGTDGPGSAPEPAGEGAGESFRGTLRKMADNPATRAMMNQGVRAMASVWFSDLVGKFSFTPEEEKYFLDLVSNGFGIQQQMGMKMMGIKDAAERQALVKEMEAAQNENKEAIKTFLNSEEDYQAYLEYEKRLPERQQLDGLRAVMNEAGAPLTAEQEAAVLEAMYQGRIADTDRIGWEGADGMDAIASGNATEKFEQQWTQSARKVEDQVAKVLEGDQMEAFRGYQEQLKEMQLMGIRMAEQMFRNEGNGGDGSGD